MYPFKREEKFVVLFEALSRCLPEGTEEVHGNISLTAASLPKEVRTLDFPITNHERLEIVC